MLLGPDSVAAASDAMGSAKVGATMGVGVGGPSRLKEFKLGNFMATHLPGVTFSTRISIRSSLPVSG